MDGFTRQDDPQATHFLNQLRLRSILPIVFAALDHDVRFQQLDEFTRIILFERNNAIDEPQSTEASDTLLEGAKRAILAFEAPDAFVRVDTHHERIAQSLRPRKKRDVSIVENVKRAAGEH